MADNRKTMLYFAPHQDDELLTMGIDICGAIGNGHDVHVILCTDGSKSKVHAKLNDGKSCSKHEGNHVYDLTSAEFVAARDKEFTDSCLALGVSPENIHIHMENRSKDGSLTAGEAEKIIGHYVSAYGKTASICTISPGNGPKQHKDHKALGRAAMELLKKKKISEVRFFIEPYHLSQISGKRKYLPGFPKKKKASAETAEKIRKAIAAYSYWAPEEGRYAVGYHSVTTEFDDFLKDMTAYYFVKRSSKNTDPLRKVKKRYSTWKKLQNRKQLYYSADSLAAPDLGGCQLSTISAGETEEYKTFCNAYGIKVTDKHLKRISDGSSYWCLIDNGEIVSSGWLAYKQDFYISETDYEISMEKSNACILYNFVTKPEHRGKGLYGILLQAMVTNAEGPDSFIIYTSPENHASQRGITKAGFTYDGTFSAADGTMEKYLKEANFTNLKRKVQLKGLYIIK